MHAPTDFHAFLTEFWLTVVIMIGLVSLAFLLYCLYVAARIGIGKLIDRIGLWRRAYTRWRDKRFEAQRRLNAQKWCIAFYDRETK